MKFLREFFAVPATISILSPFSTYANEINLNKVSTYFESDIEISSNFSNLYPSDWFYKALEEIVVKRRCAVLKPAGIIGRSEAASILNKCLPSYQYLSDIEKKLATELKYELSLIDSRDNSFNKNKNSYEAGSFSSTTVMSGIASFQLGAVDRYVVTDKLTSTYGYDLDLNTSFNGNDNLYVGIEAGNSGITEVDFTTDNSNYGSNELKITSLFYSFERGLVDFALGPHLEVDDLMPTITTKYSDSFYMGSQPVLDSNFYVLQGTGPGIALSTELENGINFSGSVIGTGADSTSGFLTDEGLDVITFSFGYNSDNYGGGIIYHKADSSCNLVNEIASSIATIDVCNDLGVSALADEGYTAFSIGGYWSPDEGKTTFSVTSNTLDTSVQGFEVDQITDYQISIEREFESGTLSASWKTFPFFRVPDANKSVIKSDDLGSHAEIYYTHRINDSLEIKPGITFAMPTGTSTTPTNDDVAFYIYDRTAIGVETIFKF